MDGQRSSRRLSLRELAEQSGVSPRTLRYYIARRLLPGPHKRGRHAAYGQEHLARIREIRRLQSQGLSLAQIARQLAEPASAGPLPQATSWRHYALAEDVVVMVRESASPWRIREVLEAFRHVAPEPRRPHRKEEEEPS